MYLKESDFPITIRSTNTDYVVFSSQGRSVLKVSKSEWRKFTPNPSLTKYCTNEECDGESIFYEDISLVKHSSQINETLQENINYVRTITALGMIRIPNSEEYSRLLIQLATETE